MTAPQPEAEPEIRVCAVCHRVLDPLTLRNVATLLGRVKVDD